MGSPDRFGRQLDGLGGGASTLSKVAVVSKSEVEGVDVDYLFIQGESRLRSPSFHDWSHVRQFLLRGMYWTFLEIVATWPVELGLSQSSESIVVRDRFQLRWPARGMSR
jgi:hypothetical protein